MLTNLDKQVKAICRYCYEANLKGLAKCSRSDCGYLTKSQEQKEKIMAGQWKKSCTNKS